MTLVRPVLNGAINLLGAAGAVSLAQAGYKAVEEPFFAVDYKKPAKMKDGFPRFINGLFEILGTPKCASAKDLATRGVTYLALMAFIKTVVTRDLHVGEPELKTSLSSIHFGKGMVRAAVLFFQLTSQIRMAQGIYHILKDWFPASLKKGIQQAFPILEPVCPNQLISDGIVRAAAAETISYLSGSKNFTKFLYTGLAAIAVCSYSFFKR